MKGTESHNETYTVYHVDLFFQIWSEKGASLNIISDLWHAKNVGHHYPIILLFMPKAPEVWHKPVWTSCSVHVQHLHTHCGPAGTFLPPLPPPPTPISGHVRHPTVHTRTVFQYYIWELNPFKVWA